jgi:DNA-directed RNA polymerase specialized sigma24 family protein
VLERVLPKADPLVFDEIAMEPDKLAARTSKQVDEPIDESRWRWADIADDVRRDLRHAIKERLTERQRTAMLLHLEGMRGTVIARKMGCTKVTVFWLLERARRQIEQYIAENPRARGRLRKALARRYTGRDQL